MINQKDTDTIQHYCGFKDATEDNLRDFGADVDKAWRESHRRRGLPLPAVDRYCLAQPCREGEDS